MEALESAQPDTDDLRCQRRLARSFALTFDLPSAFARPVTIDAAYQAQILQPRTTSKASLTDAVGDWTAQGVVHALAVGWTYRF